MAAPIRNRRAEAVKLADNLNSMEEVPVSAYPKEFSQSWVNGELTGEQMKPLCWPSTKDRRTGSSARYWGAYPF